MELGPRDIKQNQLVAVRRDTSEKMILKRENIDKQLADLLKNIQDSLFNRQVCSLNQLCSSMSLGQTQTWGKLCRELGGGGVTRKLGTNMDIILYC